MGGSGGILTAQQFRTVPLRTRLLSVLARGGATRKPVGLHAKRGLLGAVGRPRPMGFRVATV
eukprot:3887918-Pyramimonas_sp.AAC.1